LNEIPFKTGDFEVRNHAAAGIYNGFVGARYYLLASDGDALDDVYYLDESAGDNVLEVTFIDTVAWVARGTFNLSFVRDENETNPNPLHPDKLRFSNGVFEVKFIE
jgi:hypothetical protein